jgi:3-(3-hydroxy-phenyl)propionate hydroxylase
MTTPNPQVLIIGAGPTGLTAAAILNKLGISVRIIDKNHARSAQSKALGVQAGTLECLEQALGSEIVNKMVEGGKAARKAWIHIDQNEPIAVDLSTIPSRFNYILILEQSETERILEEYLLKASVEVERGTELLSFEEREGKVFAKVRTSDGATETIQGEYAIGCDGARSLTRSQLNIPFHGNTYEGDFVLGDVKIRWPWSYSDLRVFPTSKGAIAAFPLKGDQQYRLILMQKGSRPSRENLHIELSEFQKITHELSGGRIEILDSKWLSRFWVHCRMVKEFRKGRVFLAGDAAHIHSPAGGQGMNTGMQDVFNLAYKLKKVLDGHADASLLDLYHQERSPIAKSVLRGTDFVSKAALMRETAISRFFRSAVIPKMIQWSALQKRVITAISQIGIARLEIKRRG